MVVIGTRKHFEVIIMCKLLFVIGKCTVVAAYGLLVHVLQRIVLHMKFMGEFFPGYNSFTFPTPAAFEGLHFDMLFIIT